MSNAYLFVRGNEVVMWGLHPLKTACLQNEPTGGSMRYHCACLVNYIGTIII